MKTSVRLIAIYAVGWMVALFCNTLSAGPEGDDGESLLVEQVNAIELAELWHSREVQIYRSSDGLVVGFWPMGDESAPMKNGKALLGFVMVGLGDVAEQPVAVKVWGAGMVFSGETTANFVKRKDRVSLFFLPEQCVSADKCPSEIAVLMMRVDARDSSVYVNGKSVGIIK